MHCSRMSLHTCSAGLRQEPAVRNRLPAGCLPPLLWLTRARLAETREMVCDDLAAEAVGGREGYARSLLRLARMLSDRKAPRILHAIGILDANIFERRVMYLTGEVLK